MMTELFIALLTLLFGIVSGYAEIDRRRINRWMNTLETENGTLKTTVREQATRLTNAELRIENLKLNEALYKELKKDHDQLKTDHDLLQKSFDLKKAEFETAQQERDAEIVKRDAALNQASSLFEQNKKLSTQVMHYEQALRLLGQKLVENAVAESAEPKASAPSPAGTGESVDLKPEKEGQA
jgi:hypothetical protein